MSKINRITMFKLASEEDIKAGLDAYETLKETAVKDGKPYILNTMASRLHSDPRSQGFTIAARTTFASLDDMKYYDEQCEAHKALKGVVGPKQQGVLMVYMDA